MSQPQPNAPDLMAHTRDRLSEVALETASDMAQTRIRRMIKGYLPRILWPLIPGEGGSVVQNAQAALKRWFWGVVVSVVISIAFFVVFALAFLGFGLTIVWAVLFG